MGMLVVGSLLFATPTAGADEPAAIMNCPDATPLTRDLQVTNLACYEQIQDSMAKADTLAKFHKNARKYHSWAGELKVEAFATLANEFEAANATAFVESGDAKSYYGFEGGWIDKRILRDAWAAGSADHYLKISPKLRAWVIDAWTFTLKGGYKRGLADNATLAVPTFENKGTFTVKGGYSVSFDKALGWDID